MLNIRAKKDPESEGYSYWTEARYPEELEEGEDRQFFKDKRKKSGKGRHLQVTNATAAPVRGCLQSNENNLCILCNNQSRLSFNNSCQCVFDFSLSIQQSGNQSSGASNASNSTNATASNSSLVYTYLIDNNLIFIDSINKDGSPFNCSTLLQFEFGNASQTQISNLSAELNKLQCTASDLV